MQLVGSYERVWTHFKNQMGHLVDSFPEAHQGMNKILL